MGADGSKESCALVDRIFDAVDADGNGKLDKDEVLRLFAVWAPRSRGLAVICFHARRMVGGNRCLAPFSCRSSFCNGLGPGHGMRGDAQTGAGAGAGRRRSEKRRAAEVVGGRWPHCAAPTPSLPGHGACAMHVTMNPSGTPWCIPRARNALEGKGPQRRLGRRLEEIAKEVEGGYYWLQMPFRPQDPPLFSTKPDAPFAPLPPPPRGRGGEATWR